jgi:hypothetical protein
MVLDRLDACSRYSPCPQGILIQEAHSLACQLSTLATHVTRSLETRSWIRRISGPHKPEDKSITVHTRTDAGQWRQPTWLIAWGACLWEESASSHFNPLYKACCPVTFHSKEHPTQQPFHPLTLTASCLAPRLLYGITVPRVQLLDGVNSVIIPTISSCYY